MEKRAGAIANNEILRGDLPCWCVFTLEQPYLPGSPSLSLLAAAQGASSRGERRVLVTDRVDEGSDWLEHQQARPDLLETLAERIEAPVFALGSGLKLRPVHIPKPWGQEIWYTGIEARGQSRVESGGYSVPLPWLLGLGASDLLAPGVSTPNLLKILDPLAEEVFGDLYFELHEEKREVYVVTRVSDVAWPEGKGAIRYGFCPHVRAGFESDAAFREAFLNAVKRYEAVRREVDSLLDGYREQAGLSLNEPVNAEVLKEWLSGIPAELVAREYEARRAMNEFTHMVPLAPGDVVKVACLSPHALQHGVRTVEFQTPVYERRILSFAQKVLTQDHWDTDVGVNMMSLEPGDVEQLPVLEYGDGHKLEQVVMFEDFMVYRLSLDPGASYALEGDGYKLVMAVEGTVTAAGTELGVEEAALVPATAGPSAVVNTAATPGVALISVPVPGI